MSKRSPFTFEEPLKKGLPVWRSLEAKADPAAFQKRAEIELPELQQKVDVGIEALSRRTFLTISSAAAAIVGMGGCIRRPEEHILPYTKMAEHAVPGVPIHFATVTERRGDAIGILVESHEGRPTKIEGNEPHPGSKGATDVIAQASLIDLYDPDRSRAPRRKSGDEQLGALATTFSDFDVAFADRLAEHRADQGAGLRFLVQPTISPTFLRMRAAVLTQFPQAKFVTYTPVNEGNVREGARLAYGKPLTPVTFFGAARVIVAIDCDFVGTERGSVRNARAFADGRRLDEGPRSEMNRLYAVESTYSLTGANADHRLRLPSRDIERYLRALARTLAGDGLDLGPVGAALGRVDAAGIPEAWLETLAQDLREHAAQSVIVVGSRQPPRVHALAHAINNALGSAQRLVRFSPPADDEEGEPLQAITELAAEMSRVRTLVILGGNPVLDAPADLDFGAKLDGVEWSMHLSSHDDETSRRATWHVPRAHELETWGDQRAFDGSVAIQQPLIAPLWGGRSDIELLGYAGGLNGWRGHELVRGTFRGALPVGSSVDREWRRVLHAGQVARSGLPPDSSPFDATSVASALTGTRDEGSPLGPDNVEVVFTACSKMLDGRHANNSFLLELPDTITKLSWDNAALLSPATARALDLKNGDIVSLEKGNAKIERIAVWIVPGHADFSLTLPLGWGRGTQDGSLGLRYGEYQGFNVYPLRTTEGFHFTDGVRLTKSGERYNFAQTQEHQSMEGRPLAIDATLEEYREEPTFASFRSVDMHNGPLWGQVDYGLDNNPGRLEETQAELDEVHRARREHQWGMAIDLTACTGCNACVIACQAENNIPSVGRRQVARGREMYWLRIDRYFVGEDENEPAVALQPVGCQHCEEAPCENVCPVNATAHSPEGLNDMAYNRCIGTRYCMNNCPYKVRRFNYLSWHGYLESGGWGDYGDSIPETRKMSFNPNVTVRMRGVMEKCSYCVQRIQEAKIEARRENHTMPDGAVVTACQQVCPTQAIVFGDLRNPRSAIAQAVQKDRRYRLLAELGTQPRTHFLAKIRNPNPAMRSGDLARSPSTDNHGRPG